MHGDSCVNASSGLIGGAGIMRKYTQSCSRCRASKLKCDQNEPCMECIKRSVGHLCAKDERQPRTKKVKKCHDDNKSTRINVSWNREVEVEEAAQALEQFVDGTSRTKTHRYLVNEHTTSEVAPDCCNMHWSSVEDAQRQNERDHLIQDIVTTIPETDIVHRLQEVFAIRCAGPLGNIFHTPTFMEESKIFRSCLYESSLQEKVMALSRMISMDTLACHLLALVLGLAFHPTPSLLGWSPTSLNLRIQELRVSDGSSIIWRSHALRCIQGRSTIFCGSISSLQAAIMLLLDSQEEPLVVNTVLATAITGARTLGLHNLGQARLKVPPSLISPENRLSTSTKPSYLRTEIGVRIWWALVMRDWSQAPAMGYYSIHPSQFNTRKPLHVNDDDLCATTSNIDSHGQLIERPRSEYTMLSYTIHALEIATFARESVDMRSPFNQKQGEVTGNNIAKTRTQLNKKYETFVAELPSYFRLGSVVGLHSTGPLVAIPVHRWMLHQQLWSLFLRIHRSSLSFRDGRALCQLLAQNIITTQAQIHTQCAVCGSLSTSDTQLFNAAIILVIDLLFSSLSQDVDCTSAQLGRYMAIDKIREAVELLRAHSEMHNPKTERLRTTILRGITVLEALLNLELEESRRVEASEQANATEHHLDDGGIAVHNREYKSITIKVMDILETLERNQHDVATPFEQANSDPSATIDSLIPLPTATNKNQDLNVLPILSNDPSLDFRQYFDFSFPDSTTHEGFFSASAYLQASTGLVSPGPSSGETQSLSDINLSGLIDTCIHRGGTPWRS